MQLGSVLGHLVLCFQERNWPSWRHVSDLGWHAEIDIRSCTEGK